LSESTGPAKSKLDDVKKELRCVTSLHGYSTVFNTSSPFIKVLWVFFFLVLFSGCIQNALENLDDYYQYTVITKIEYVNENPMTLPAVTLCLASIFSYSTNATLDKALFHCEISGLECEYKDFYSFETRTSYSKDIVTCYVLNGGRNSSKNFSKIKSTKTTGPYSGLLLRLYLQKDHFLFYYINDAYVKPIISEIDKHLIPGTYNDLKLEKNVETKLEFPFNNCWKRKNLPDTHLVRQLTEANITYRQVNCFELCFQNVVQNYALEHKITEDEARETEEVKNFDKEKNCDNFCPLECESAQYKISDTMFTLADIGNGEYGSKWISEIREKLNQTINSTKELHQNYLKMSVFFDSLKYTKISQTPKTTLSTLVSNLGGSTGLFLDLSFMSACRVSKFDFFILTF